MFLLFAGMDDIFSHIFGHGHGGGGGAGFESMFGG